MKLNTLLMICSFLFLPSCADIPLPPSQETHSLVIQAYSDSPIIAAAIQTLVPKINSLIKQELGLDPDYDFAFFIPKKRQRITLYYVSDIGQKNDPILISALEKMNLAQIKITNVNVTSDAQFFGDRQDELVMMIDDPERELASLNQQIKAMAHQLNDTYHKQHDLDLYNVAKSERYPFITHMGLGRIRLSSIKNHTQSNDVLDRIRTRIRDIAHEELQQLITTYTSLLHFKSFGILEFQKQIYLKEWKA